MGHSHNFEYYKSKISIIQILTDLGYKYDPADGKNTPTFKLYNSQGIKIDEVIIKNPKKPDEHYYDRNNKGGDLISFIQNHIDQFPNFHHNNTWIKINQILAHYANEPFDINYNIKYNHVKKDFDINRFIVNDATVKELAYLSIDRKIDKEIIEEFLPFIKLVKDTENTKGDYFNVGFPFRTPGKEDITNIEIRNFGFRGFAENGDKSNSVWIATKANAPELVLNLYFFESAIDGISYYELNKDKINLDNSAIVSIGGTLTKNQILNTLNLFNNAKVHTGFDNDINGHIYDMKVQALVKGKELKVRKEKTTDLLVFELHGKKQTKIFSIPINQANIESFRKASGLTGGLKVHKPLGEHDYNDILKKKRII